MVEEKKQFIEGLQAGEKVRSSFLLTKKDTKKDKNNKYFCDLELQDMTGIIPGKIWSESIGSTDINSFKKRDVVFIEGEVNDSDKFGKQINIKSITKVDEKSIDYSDFIFINKKIDDKTLKILIAELKNKIDSVKNINIKTLLDSFFEDSKFFEKFCNATAAIKNHHAAVGGLLLHSISVARICKFIADTYNRNDDLIDEDVLFCGSMLHDVGKTDSYSVGMTIGINEEEENLVSHISLGYGMVLMKIEKIKDFPENLKREILHIILSHHGIKEYGSPVEPQTLEAIIVYNADRFDADIDHYTSLAAESPEDECWPFSNYFKRRIAIKKSSFRNGKTIKGESGISPETEGKSSIGSSNKEKLEKLKIAMQGNSNLDKTVNPGKSEKEASSDQSDFEQKQLL
jgi:3'-5' exoribonuclease